MARRTEFRPHRTTAIVMSSPIRIFSLFRRVSSSIPLLLLNVKYDAAASVPHSAVCVACYSTNWRTA